MIPSMAIRISTKSLTRLFAITQRSVPRGLCTPSMATESRTQKLERIADELLDLTKLEKYDYSVLFRFKMGHNKYGPAVTGPSSPDAAAAGPGSAKKAETSEKTAFDIKLEKYEASAKIKIIKELRTFTDLGLKEAKELVEKVPVVMKKGVTKEEGDKIVEKLKELGATVVLE